MANKKQAVESAEVVIHDTQIGSYNENRRVTIKKAKIKDGMFLEVEYDERASDGDNNVKKSCTAIVHDDLKNAFNGLNIHIENICELANHQLIKAKGFTIGGSGDHEGVCLIGSSELELGLLNLVTPFVKWDSDYKNIAELGEVIEACKAEVLLYLFEEKHQPDAQLELEFDEN